MRERLWTYEEFAVRGGTSTVQRGGRLREPWLHRRRSAAKPAVLSHPGERRHGGGLGTFIVYPVAYQANVTVLVKNNPADDAVSAMLTEETMVQSESVAAGAVKALGLTQSVSSFQAAYTVTVVTDQVLTITANAPTSSGAVDRANEIAGQYMRFRASVLRAQQAQDVAAYAQQVPQAQQQIAALQTQISQLKGQPSDQTELTTLQNRLNDGHRHAAHA